MTAQLPLLRIPLDGLPIAAAALDRQHVIVAANQKFVGCAVIPTPSARG